MSDPRDFDRNRDFDSRAMDRSSNAMWGWIAGIVFLVVVLALVFGSGREGTRTAGTTMPPASTAPSTTGSGSSSPSPSRMTPPATSPAPANPAPTPAPATPSTPQ